MSPQQEQQEQQPTTLYKLLEKLKRIAINCSVGSHTRILVYSLIAATLTLEMPQLQDTEGTDYYFSFIFLNYNKIKPRFL